MAFILALDKPEPKDFYRKGRKVREEKPGILRVLCALCGKSLSFVQKLDHFDPKNPRYPFLLT